MFLCPMGAAVSDRRRQDTSTARAAAVLLVCLAASTAASAAPLSLDAALNLAQKRSRQLSSHDASAAASRHMAVAASRRPDPVLTAGISNLPVNGPDRFSLTRDFMTMRSVGVMQELTRAGKLSARAARYESEAEVAQASRTLALAALQRETATAWLERHFRQGVHDVLVAQREEAQLLVEASDAAYRAGRGSQADAFASRAAVALLDDRIAEARQQVDVAHTQLERWTGPLPAEGLASPPPLDAVPLRAEELEPRLAQHPEIELMARMEAMAQAEAEIARSERRPDASVELMYSQRGPAYSNMVSLNVSVPLQWDRENRQDRELAAKLALIEQRSAEREEAMRARVAEARTMLQQWQSHRERLARYDSALLPLASERTRAALAAYRGGTGPLTGVLESRQGEIDTRLERLRLEMDTARMWAQLSYLIPAGHDTTASR
jgi:outer membrane protein TolC